jgi:hypothetical protein
MMDDKANRRTAAALVGAYHEARLAELLEHVRDAFRRYDSGEIDAFELDDVIHHYKRAARELWKFCVVSGGRVLALASVLEESAAAGELPDSWEIARRPVRGSG